MPPPVEWSSLPLELLQEIVHKLGSIIEFIRFRSTCNSWRSAATLSLLPPQSPFLMLPFDQHSDARPFLCISTGIVHTLRLSRNYRICGSAHGWLALVDHDTTVITLTNPFTASLISLPPSRFLGDEVNSAEISANPMSASGFTVTITIYDSSKLAFCKVRPGRQSRWRTFYSGLRLPTKYIARLLGKLCAVDGTGTVAVCKTWQRDTRLFSAEVVCRAELPSLGEGWSMVNWQIVDALGQLLLVTNFMYHGNDIPTDTRECFQVYMLKNEGQEQSWVVAGRVGRRAHDNRVWGSIGEFLRCRDCLYLVKVQEKNEKFTGKDEDCFLHIVMVYVLDFKTGCMRQLNFNRKWTRGFVWIPTWFVPSLI